MIVKTIPVSPPYDFGLYPKLFIHEKNAFLPFRYSPTRWSRLISADNGVLVAVSVTCEYSPEPKLSVDFSRDIPTALMREIQERLASCFCADVDLRPVYREAKENSHLKQLISELEGLKPHLSLDPFESLIKVIIRQVVRATTAQRLTDNLVQRFGSSLSKDGITYYSFPSPKALATASKAGLLDCRIGYKWKVIREVSREVVKGDLDFHAFRMTSDDEIVEILSQFKSIGPWTSRVFLYDGMHRLDSYPEFDISIKRATKRLRVRRVARSLRQGTQFRSESIWGVMVSYLFGSLWLNNLSVRSSLAQREKE